MAGLNAIDDDGGSPSQHSHSFNAKKKLSLPLIAGIGLGGAILIYFVMKTQNSGTTAAANTTVPSSSITSAPLDPTSESEAALATENLSGQMGNLLQQVSTENAALTANQQGYGQVTLGAPAGSQPTGIWQNSVAAYSSPSANPSSFQALPFDTYSVAGPSVAGWSGTGGLTPIYGPGNQVDYIEGQNITGYSAPSSIPGQAAA